MFACENNAKPLLHPDSTLGFVLAMFLFGAQAPGGGCVISMMTMTVTFAVVNCVS